MKRRYGLVRLVMLCSWGLLLLSAVFTNLDGIFGFGLTASRILVISLWVTCFASATCVIVFDRAARLVAALILFVLLVLLLPTL